MIESKTLASAVGIQYQGVIDNSESTSLPSLANGVIVGRFKRGRMDKPFKVTANNYRSLLGRDPSNPSYLAIEDAFKRGISEVEILRVGSTGGVVCTASSLELMPRVMVSSVASVASEASHASHASEGDTIVGLGYFATVSRNGGAFKTYNLAEIQGAFYKQVMAGSEFGSLAFIDYPNDLDMTNAAMLESRGQPIYEMCGINSNGSLTTSDGGVTDLTTEAVRLGGRMKTPPHKITKEHNWLVFKPTDGVAPRDDFYYEFKAAHTSTGAPIEIHSCAAVVPYNDPNVCTYSGVEILYKNGQNQPTGDLYGRYRIDGGAWVDYTAQADYHLVNKFLSDTGVIESQGGGGTSFFQNLSGSRGGYLTGAAAQKPYANGQDGVVEVQRKTIDFKLTDGGENDLVRILFGGNVSVSSCALGRWYGV